MSESEPKDQKVMTQQDLKAVAQTEETLISIAQQIHNVEIGSYGSTFTVRTMGRPNHRDHRIIDALVLSAAEVYDGCPIKLDTGERLKARLRKVAQSVRVIDTGEVKDEEIEGLHELATESMLRLSSFASYGNVDAINMLIVSFAPQGYLIDMHQPFYADDIQVTFALRHGPTVSRLGVLADRYWEQYRYVLIPYRHHKKEEVLSGDTSGD